ncbi:extracellular solute-binding protein [Ascidiaceihabitans sp.]|uniref:extracellular solute-binding protein n=1 Tax=Ascidiaceihabitans sp. TaxID=1872644 RepID=UPI003296BDEB
MYGEPALPPDFVSLPYVNAAAPKTGRIVLGNTGGFDSLNPFVFKGTKPWQLPFLTHETLMGRSLDEPFTLYGLLAESIEVPDNRKWIEFKLRDDARFADGTPLTVKDVIWSFKTLGTKGHPKYHGLWNQIETIEETKPGHVRMTFNTDNRELVMLVGLRPILKAAQWDGKDFANAALNDIPVGSGPYSVTDFEAGRFVQLTRNPDYWGKDVPFVQGTHNFDAIRIDFYGDGDVLREGFKAGQISAVREFNAETWARSYDFPRAQSGDVVKTEIPHQKPSGMTGFVMNTRKAPFDDWRVREAMIQAFNFEYINDTFTGGAQPRITSYFSNSALAMKPGKADADVTKLLAPFSGSMPPDAINGYTLPASDGSLRNRKGLRRAMKLLAQAGYTVDGGMMRDASGTPLRFSILLPKGSTENAGIADIYIGALKRLGIEVTIETVDDAQFVERTGSFAFDMTHFRRALSLSPGNEQRFYWGSAAASQDGSRNLMGVQSPAIDAMIDAMLAAPDQQQFNAAVRALDRSLMAGRYVIPFWSFTTGRIAHMREMKRPDVIPAYGDGPSYMPHVWWWQP